MWLQVRMFLLVGLLFGILYGAIVGIGSMLVTGGNIVVMAIVMAVLFMGIQYMIAPFLVTHTMRIRWVSEEEAPDLHRMVGELAQKANLPKPKVGISQMGIPNAFAFGRTQRDGRICVTEGILRLLSRDELKAVLGHEMAHIKHRDMAIITILSAIPMIMYWIAMALFFRGMFGDRRGDLGAAMLIGIGAFILYQITNLLVLYGSRIREYYADKGSVELGSQPHQLASALYKLVYGNARFQGREELKEVQGVKAFFVNDPSRAYNELRELSQVDRDMSGTIDAGELIAVRGMDIKLTTSDKIMEMFTTHPNMLKRIQHLSSLNVY
ncbi:MAG: zinc metalloprotease HtpX [Chloroflexota bacterium]|nr:zinc metalloprotease HtpX [Chloroflexota bacterium]